MVKWCGTLVPVFAAMLGLCVSESHAQTVRDDMAFLAQPANVQPTYDTMLELARGYDLGYTEVAVANLKVDPWSPASGDDLVLPTQQILPAVPRRGIVINLADQRLYYYSPDSVLRFTAPVGIGGMDGETPTGQTKVVNKRVNPTWYPTPSIRKRHPEMPAVVPPGPDNPLGTLALYLGWPTYLIHGTNRPLSIGRRLTSGCIRLYPKDIKTLFSLVKEGTPVMVIDQPVKVGWLDGELYLQVHPSQKQAEDVEATGTFTPEPASDLAWLIVSKAGDAVGRIDWRLDERAAEERNGIAVKITAPRQPDRHMAAGEP
jgi:L,D-transpeptidase ErfK/SrfK